MTYPLKDLINALGVSMDVASQVLTADANGGGVDLIDHESCMFVGLIGASGDTLSGSVYLELEIEESEDNSTWTDAADADVRDAITGTNVGTFAKIDDPAEDVLVYKAQYVGKKRYARCVVNLTGTHTNGIPVAVMAIRGGKTEQP